jgi:signal transduction histidine kinase
MSLRAKLGILFLGALQVTFLTAVAAFWAVQSWQLLTDDLTMIHEQNLRLDRTLEETGLGPGEATRPGRMVQVPAGVLPRLRELADHSQTLEESERIAGLAEVLVGSQSLADASVPLGREAPAGALRHAIRELKDFYNAQVGALRARARFVTRLSTGLFLAIVGIVLGGMMAYFTAIRVWLVRPIQMLSRATAIISTGNLEHRIAANGRDELGQLAGSINSMAASLSDIQGRLVAAERFAAIGEMSAYVAHNIRNPLASIRATAQSELDGLPASDPQRASFGDIVTAVDRLHSWVADLLRFSSPVTLQRSEENLNVLIERCIDMTRSRLAGAGVQVALSLDAALPPVSLDRAKIEQVVSVVLGNAVEASPAGGTIGLTSHLAAEASGASQACIRVEDRGVGIPPERLGAVFTLFSTTKKSGTGLGLALAHKIVTAHDGTISVANRDGGGTAVEIRLPVRQGEGDRVGDPHR